MKRKTLLLIITLLMVLPVTASGQDKHSLSFKPGVYFFTGDLEDEHPMGFYSELVYGYKIHRNLILESGIGYFHDGVSKGNDVRGVPVTIAVKGVYPMKNFEPFAGGGVGIYVTKYKGTLHGDFVDDSDTVLGGHLIVGADYTIASHFFIGIEGKYLVTEKADYDGVKADLDGFIALVRVGFRF